jgi:hypothetical protein
MSFGQVSTVTFFRVEWHHLRVRAGRLMWFGQVSTCDFFSELNVQKTRGIPASLLAADSWFYSTLNGITYECGLAD